MRLIRLDDGLVDVFEAANGTEGWEKKKWWFQKKLKKVRGFTEASENWGFTEKHGSKKREKERKKGKTRESRGEKEQRRYVFHGSEAKLRSCRDIAEIFKVAKKKKKKESFENRVENATTTMCVRVCVWRKSWSIEGVNKNSPEEAIPIEMKRIE